MQISFLSYRCGYVFVYSAKLSSSFKPLRDKRFNGKNETMQEHKSNI